VSAADLTDERIHELYELAHRLAAEDEEHFTVHARTNDLVHVFRRVDTGEVVGFQFWLARPIDLPRSQVVIAGKVRVTPAFRNRGLHLLSCVAFYARSKVRHPFTRYYWAAMASVLGFVSFSEALADYRFFDPKARQGEAGAIRDTFVAMAEDNHFTIDEETGVIFVDIFLTPETLGRYPESFFERRSAKVYAAANPEFRTNGSYIGFWFRFTARNVLALSRQVMRKLARSS
jgi:hypothetical protein